MEHVLVRYDEIGTKSREVRRRMLRLLTQRIRERLAYEGIEASVRPIQGRLVVECSVPSGATTAAGALGELPGVASTSPAIRTDPTLDAVARATGGLEIGERFGIDANVAGDYDLDSHDVNRQIGAHVEDRTGATVDLDRPDTWIEIDFRDDGGYVFTERHEGPGGFPVGSQDPVAVLVSGGIDSPVAAHALLTRGADVVPLYFYNRPVAAADHRARFEESIETLRRFHPGKRWTYFLVDMAAVNERLQSIDGGRMILHRIVMFRVAERIAEREGLSGIVTGESLGQKSSQTGANLATTSRRIDLPIHRPLLTDTKHEITERAREIGTFETATVASACRSLAPDSPAPEIEPDRLDQFAAEVGLDELVELALGATEEIELATAVRPRG